MSLYSNFYKLSNFKGSEQTKMAQNLDEWQKSKQPEAHNYSFIYFYLFIMHM